MINTLSLLTTIGSVVLGSIAPTFNNEPKTQNEDPNPVSIIQWDIDDATRVSTASNIATFGNTYLNATISKYQTNKNNNYIDIQETTYTQTISISNYSSQIYQYKNYYDYGSIRYETSMLTITQITTYSGITNNNITYTISLLNNNSIAVNPELEADITQLKTNNDLSQYINLTAYGQYNITKTLYTDITNNYSTTTIKNLDNELIIDDKDLSTDIQLNNIWKTYIITYVQWDQTTQQSLGTTNSNYNNYGEDLFTLDNGEIFGKTAITGGYEVVDIPSLMFTILTLPFSFITQAFNITMFPNTPYSINIGNLFLSIVAIIILMWLLQKIIGFFSKS